MSLSAAIKLAFGALGVDAERTAVVEYIAKHHKDLADKLDTTTFSSSLSTIRKNLKAGTTTATITPKKGKVVEKGETILITATDIQKLNSFIGEMGPQKFRMTLETLETLAKSLGNW